MFLPRLRPSTATTRLFPRRKAWKEKPCRPTAPRNWPPRNTARFSASLYNFNAVSLRYFNVFGPRQDPGSQYAAVIPIFITRMLRGQPPIIYGDGHQSRDFIYVENVVQANLLAANATDFRGEVFNIGTASRITVKELAGILNSLLGVKMSPVYADPRPGDIMESYADISRAEHHLGFRPEVDFEKGLKLTIDWYKSRMG